MTDAQREAMRIALEVLQSAGLVPQGVEAGGEILAIRDAMVALDIRLMDEIGVAGAIGANAERLDRIVDAMHAFDKANDRPPTRLCLSMEFLWQLRLNPGDTLLGMVITEGDQGGPDFSVN